MKDQKLFKVTKNVEIYSAACFAVKRATSLQSVISTCPFAESSQTIKLIVLLP